MLHRHLTHEVYTLAAIDDLIDRGQWADWLALRRAALDDPAVLAKVQKISLAHADNPYAQRHAFWRRFAHRYGAGPDIADPIIQRPAYMAGQLDGIDTGIRDATRTAPIEPSEAENLRVISIHILMGNAAQDYRDFVSSVARLGQAATAQALISMDAIYPQSTGQSALQQLMVQLASPLPYDLDDQEDMEWYVVKAACIDAALSIFDRLNDAA